MHKSFTKEDIKNLRLRLGWSQSDLARNIGCPTDLISALEKGNVEAQGVLSSELEIIERHADQISDALHIQPIVENQMEEAHLEQVDTNFLMNEV